LCKRVGDFNRTSISRSSIMRGLVIMRGQRRKHVA
jgi:hypothetical protein